MSFTLIAKRYARALILEAKEQNLSNKVGSELEKFASFYENKNSDFFELMNNPVFNSSERSDIILLISDTINASNLIRRFMSLLVSRVRINLLPFIKSEYFREIDFASGRIRARITSANYINKNFLDKILLSLKSLLGMDVVAELVYDKGMLGGIKTEIGGFVFDGTLKNSLENLQKTLIFANY